MSAPDARGRTAHCLPFCQGGLHETDCPEALVQQPVRHSRVVAEARDLRSVEGENPEYDRALVEMCMRLLDRSDEDRAVVEALVLGDREGVQ